MRAQRASVVETSLRLAPNAATTGPSHNLRGLDDARWRSLLDQLAPSLLDQLPLCCWSSSDASAASERRRDHPRVGTRSSITSPSHDLRGLDDARWRSLLDQ